jgi:phosphopantothenoylcysteine synthetase/decarboxylase
MKFLITAGPTREPIDPVRFISNRSSGKMGYAIAEAAVKAGHEVVLVSGPVSISAPAGAMLVSVMTSDEMHDAVHANLPATDVAVLSAAVADFKPAEYFPRKIKKQDGGIAQITLVPTHDILASLGSIQPRTFLLAGFAAETHDMERNALRKLREKQCDVIIANDVSRADIGFEGDENEVTLFFADQSSRLIPKSSKRELAYELVQTLTEKKKSIDL